MKLASKIARFLRRLRTASLRRMGQHLNAIHRETGKNRGFLLCDMLWCTLRYLSLIHIFPLQSHSALNLPQREVCMKCPRGCAATNRSSSALWAKLTSSTILNLRSLPAGAKSPRDD